MSSSQSTLTRFSRSSLTLVAAAAIAGSALVVAAPAQAASTGIGTGRAVVHVDAPQATVTKQADGTYLLAMPQGTTGQWMGERKNANGKTVVRVGNLTGEKLASNWSNLKYTSAGVTGTLVWDAKSATRQAVAVKVSKPKTTDTGVTFTLASTTELPASMTDVSINLDRAAKNKATRAASNYPLSQSSAVTGNLRVALNNPDANSATFNIYDSTASTATDNTKACFTATQTATTNATSVGSKTCAGIPYADNSQCWYNGRYTVACGVSSSWSTAGDPNSRAGLFSIAYTPAGSSKKYNYSKAFAWYG